MKIEQSTVENLTAGDRVIYVPDAEVNGDQLSVNVYTVSETPWVYRNGTYMAFNVKDTDGNVIRFYGWASDIVPVLTVED